MNMPGFSAEASLYQKSRHYGVGGTSRVAQLSTRVWPQAGLTGPYGPIGLPGQDCYGACLHVCMSFCRGFLDQCLNDCLSTCSEPLSYLFTGLKAF